jgi:TPR repeat protein
MDYPFDEDGNLTDIARSVFDTEDFFRVYEGAEGGNADDQYQIGIWHLDGGNKMAREDEKEASAWLAKAAEQGHEKAQKVLAQIKIVKDEEKPKHLRCYICLACLEKYYPCYDECDNTAEMRRMEEEENQEKGGQILKEAEQGSAEAQLKAGYTYENGVYLPQDYTKAVEWWTKSAEQGNTEAQSRLGFYYDNGKGVPKDHAKAFEWYSKAAEQGDAFAQCKIGRHYSEGEGVTQDLAKAAEWYQKAADQGDSMAKYYLDKHIKERGN